MKALVRSGSSSKSTTSRKMKHEVEVVVVLRKTNSTRSVPVVLRN
jgi:hypothetical protein